MGVMDVLSGFQLGGLSRGPEDHIDINVRVPRSKTWGIPETMVRRILLFMWSFGPLLSKLIARSERTNAAPKGAQ